MLQNARSIRAFTLVELLVGMLVVSILLSAIATLAFAFVSADAAEGDTAVKQAQLRHATVHFSELIRHCKLICATPETDVVVWRADENGDGRINVHELVYVESGTGLDLLRLAALTSGDNSEVTLAELALPITKSQLAAGRTWQYTTLIPNCDNVQFVVDQAAPFTAIVAVLFDLTENEGTRQYQIAAALRCRADHLLNAAGDALVAHDDD